MSQSPTAPDAASHAENRQRYTAALANELELRWQARWAGADAFRVPNPGEPGFDASRPKYFCLDMFPYPSGAGLHVGHPEGYTATDIVCRFRRMSGFNVLHPMGWDAFGLPAEQYAMQTGVHPAVTTRAAIDNFRRQLQRFGFCYDWSREISTTDPEYYRWTQWIWLQAYHAWYDPDANRARPVSELLQELKDGSAFVGPSGELVRPGSSGKIQALGGDPIGVRKWHELSPEEQRDFVDDRRLAYLGEQTVNWCPKLGTVLANEEVIDGRSERGAFPVFRMPLRQWMFRITAYAERLLEDLSLIRWPDSTRIMQTEWIGRSEGADIDFDLEGRPNVPFLRVFTTRPDTVFGATYMVVAPEHPLIDDVLAAPPANTDVSVLATYVAEARRRADVDRMTDTKEKTGVFTGVYAVNPATLERIPVWTADYVLMGYGHGAIMAVPAHDQRDFEFAQAFDLPVRDVVYPPALAAVRAFVERATDRVLESPALTVLVSEFLARCVDTDEDPSDAYRDLMDGRDVDQPGRPGPEAEAWREAIEARTGQNLRQVVRAVRRHGLTLATGRADADDGIAVNSARAGDDGVSITGLATTDAKQVIIDWLEAQGLGQRRVNYRLRDWLFSRQRYWGEPFPIVFDESGNHYPVSEEHLPVRLPELADYSPIESEVPVPPLSKATAWVNTTAGAAGVDPEVLPPDRVVRRETNTMPGWAGSCWYYLRFCDPHNDDRFVGEDAERYWMVSERTNGTPHAGGVDLYVGGAEHAVLHLLYARFWHKLLFDLGHVSTPEPAGRLFHQGLIQSFAYQRPDKTLVPMDEVEERTEGQWFERGTDTPLVQVVAKMSKSLKNVINPDDVIAEFGADTFRLYEMYMGPLDASKPWNTRDIAGPFRFLQRFWRMCVDEQSGAVQTADAADDAIERQLHRTIQRVGSDIERLAMNTAIAAMIEFVNLVSASGRQLTRDQMSRAVRVLSPFAPHMAEEIWSRLGEKGFVSHAAWPSYDDRMLVDDTLEIPVQVNGKLRSRITVAANAGEDDLRTHALEDARIAEQIAGKTVRKVIVVPGRLVNVLVG